VQTKWVARQITWGTAYDQNTRRDNIHNHDHQSNYLRNPAPHTDMYFRGWRYPPQHAVKHLTNIHPIMHALLQP
jgi:hypothetical protein